MSTSPLAERFRVLARQWKKDTAHLSVSTRMAEHPAYQEIISMGVAVVPLILAELRRKPDFWFMALRTLTGENPVLPKSAGKIKEMASAWIKWGKENGYC